MGTYCHLIPIVVREGRATNRKSYTRASCLVLLLDALAVVAQPCGIRPIDRIIVRERIGIAGRCGAHQHERIGTREAPDDRVVHARTEVHEAERTEVIAAVPLLAAVVRRAGCDP